MSMEYGLFGNDGHSQSNKGAKTLGCVICALVTGGLLGAAISGSRTTNLAASEMASIPSMRSRPLRLRAALKATQTGYISGQPATERPSFRSDFLREKSGTLPVVKPIGVETAVEETSQPEPISVHCAPEQHGEECYVTFQVKVMLEPAVAAAIQWVCRPFVVVDVQNRPVGSRPVVAVGSVEEDSEAYRRGMRPGMVVKTLIGGFGRHENEVSEMTDLIGVDDGHSYIDAFLESRNFIHEIRNANHPITLMMLERVKGGSQAMKPVW